MKTKKCSNPKCFVPVKPISEFHKKVSSKDGLQPSCKKCCEEYKKEHYLKNRDIIRKQQKEHRKKFPWKETLSGIKQRCNNPNDWAYKYYGGRGIKCLITEEELEKLWYRDKAYLMEKPSIDRNENDKDYAYDNCQFIEQSLNSGKDKRKPIFQYDLDGIFVREWYSQAEASRSLNISQGHISSVASGNRKSVGGFVWRDKDD